MLEMLVSAWNEFWIVVWIPPLLWAVVLLMDVFQTNHIFQDRWDGPIISSLFLIFPGLAFFIFFPFEFPSLEKGVVMVVSGIFSAMAVFYYFSALKHRDDVVIADSLNSIAIVLVPLINYLVFGIDYNFYGVLAIMLAFASALLFAIEPPLARANLINLISSNPDFWKAFVAMMISVMFLTLSIVMADHAYSFVPFATGIALFSLGNVVVGIILWIFCPNMIETVKHTRSSFSRTGILALARDNWRIFLIAELTAMLAIVFFQRAVDLGDAAIAVIIESTTPFVVMLLSLIVLSIRIFAKSLLLEIGKKQLYNPIIKLIASIGMLISLALVMLFI